MSIFRQPIIKTLHTHRKGFRDRDAVSPVTGEPDPFANSARYDDAIATLVDSSLLSLDDSGWVFVHRWTASELEDLCKTRGVDEFLSFAHKIAWLYWTTNVLGTQHGIREQIHCLLQAYHHCLAADLMDAAEQAMGSLVGHLNTVGAWDMARRLIEDLLERLGPDAPTRARWLQTLAAFVERQGDADRASLLDLQAIMTQPNAAQDNTFIGIGFHNQAIIAAQKGMYQFAESQLSMAIWRFEQDDNQPMLAEPAFPQLSNIVAALGRRGEARDHVEKGLQIFMSLPDCHPERRSGIALAHRM